MFEESQRSLHEREDSLDVAHLILLGKTFFCDLNKLEKFVSFREDKKKERLVCKIYEQAWSLKGFSLKIYSHLKLGN